MRYKKILFTFLSAAFFGVACADDYSIRWAYWSDSGSITVDTRTFSDVSLYEVFLLANDRCAFRMNLNNCVFQDRSSNLISGTCISNLNSSVSYSTNPLRDTLRKELRGFCSFYKSLGLPLPVTGYIANTNGIYVEFWGMNPTSFRSALESNLSSLQLKEYYTNFIYTLESISEDTSSIVPALESHAVTVSNLAAQVYATSTQITNRQAQSNSSLQDIRDVVNSIGSSVAGIPNLISNQSLDTMSIDDLGSFWLDLKGVDWRHSSISFPLELAQEVVSSGLASSVTDAQLKLSDPAWRNSTFVPRVKYDQKKANSIAQLEASGISPPAGKSWRDLEVPELETIFEYQYNTPVADVTEVTTNWLPNIGGKVDDIAGSLSDIRDRVEDGVFEVNVMNWPDDFLGFSVTLSNAFAEAFANLSITGRVIELDEDYKRYRELYGLNGINAPSFDIVFSNAQFLAVGSPNDVNWWRESQNLLSYIAYYGTYNERIYNEISSTNFLAELAAITNRLSVLGDVEATVRRLTDDAIESGEDIKSTLENLTYYRGVSKWCDDYLQAGDTPDRVHLFDLDDHEFYIDIGQSYGFVDLIHGISAFAITLSWICTLPYMIIWLIEWFRKFADFWATKIVGP